MINALLLGNKKFPVNLIQGPLAGYSSAPFRLLMHQYSAPAFSCTEMISAKSLIHQPKKSFERYIKKHPNEGPVCFQLSGNDPKELGLAAKIVTDCGADLIDLNCGCPVKKIRSKGAGSSLLTNSTQLYQLITALKTNTHLPISVKIRVEGDSNEKFNQEIAKIVSDAGTDFLIVHGRHWTERYDIACRYDQIKFFVDELNIPVIGNGDISCVDTLKKMFATGCAGIMIGRAGVGQPWLIKKLITQMNGDQFICPPLSEIGSIFLEHISCLTTLFSNNKFAILQARKLVKYYARGIDNRLDLMSEINLCQSFDEIKQVTMKYFI